MISLYKAKETNFKHNGRVLKDTLSCLVTEEANGIYELELEYPSNELALELTEGKIIKAPTPRGPQLFRIYRPIKTLKLYKIYARHIFYDLLDNFIEDSRPTEQNGAFAINKILTDTVDPHSFTGYSDITSLNTSYLIRKNAVQALIGNDENSFISRWGGELIRDNFEIRVLSSGGTNRGYTVRLGKNLVGIEETLDISKVSTKLYPTVVLADEEVYTLPEKYVESPLIDNYPHPIIREVRIELTDEQREMDIEDLYPMMRQYCNNLFEINDLDKPKVNYKVDFIELSKTEQYKELAILEQIDIYDTVAVIVDTLDIMVKSRVIKTVYDSLRDRYEQIELGNFTNKLSNQRQQITETINKAIKEMEDTTLASKMKNITDRITGNLGGYIITRLNEDGKPYEILIMDIEDINTATNVIRANKEGIGWSTNGYNGPFDIAISAKDGIIADYITTGILNANLLKAGAIQNQEGNVWWNVENGHININNKLIYDGETLKVNLSDSIQEIIEQIPSGRNLILNSNMLIEFQETDEIEYTLSTPLQAEQDYTLSIEGEKTEDMELWIDGVLIGSIEENAITFNLVETPVNNNITIKSSNIEGYINRIKLEKGNTITDWTIAPEDTQTQIDGKADTDKVNEIEHTLGEVKADVESKAEESILAKLQDDFGDLVGRIAEDKEEAEGKVLDLQDRTEAIEFTLGDKSVVWDFIATKIYQSEEGVFIGEADGKTGILIGTDRISLIDNKVEVAFIAGQVMQINHGIFVKSATVDTHKLETIPDTDILLFNYVGGEE